MNSIGFNNFRRFANFPEMDLGNITLLVGGNNSGKSTLVKALLLCLDNMRLMTAGSSRNIFGKYPQFRFDANYWHDVKIKTFARAIYNKAKKIFDFLPNENPQFELTKEMQFAFAIENFKFVIGLFGNPDDEESVTANVSYVSIEDRKNMVKYAVSFETDEMSFSLLGSTSERETLIKRLYNDYRLAKESLESLSESGDDIAAISSQSEKVASLERRIEEFVNPEGGELPDDFDYEEALRQRFKEFHSGEYTTAVWDLPYERSTDRSVEENLFIYIIENFIAFAKNPGLAQPSDIKDPDEYGAAIQTWMCIQDARASIGQEEDRIRKSLDDLVYAMNINVEYVSAHAANQNTIYNTADRNDYIAQTVHEFVRAKIAKGEAEYTFVTDWMEKFGIGSNFEIKSIDGEAYRVKIVEPNKSIVNLADKGMGSIQLMILLLRLATIIRTHALQKLVEDPTWRPRPIIIIEEPEQNLHPKVQSILAELFRDLNRDYHCNFLIETHSEYLIRKTQVLVAEENYEDEADLKENNPFMVYYFDGENKKKPYYSMDYRPDGKFSNEFGTGFFDTAANLAFELF